MKTNKNAYLVSIYLKAENEQSTMVAWKQDFEPTLPEILKKTILHCVDKKLTNELLDNPANAIVRKVDSEYNMDEVAEYILDKEQLKQEFFEYIEMDI